MREVFYEHNLVGHPDPTADRRAAHLAIQHRLGLLPKWGLGHGRRHRASAGFVGPSLTKAEENPKILTTNNRNLALSALMRRPLSLARTGRLALRLVEMLRIYARTAAGLASKKH
jgi:hypothetical protein